MQFRKIKVFVYSYCKNRIVKKQHCKMSGHDKQSRNGKGSVSRPGDGKRTPTRSNPSPVFSESQEAFIRAEIVSQLVVVKKQIDIEVRQDLDALRGAISKEIKAAIADIRGSVAADVRDVRSSVASDIKNVEQQVNKTNSQIVVSQERQLATVKKVTKDLVMVVGQQITSQVYGKVMDEINTKIVPKVNNMVQYVNYQMQDGGEVVTDYRMAVDRQYNGTGDTKRITDGNDKHILQAGVSLFFTDDGYEPDKK
jgi:hypothetical protein